MLLASDPFPWLAVFGRLHPVVLHLPIGLVPGLFVLEFGAMLLRREPPRGALLALALLTAVCAAVAAASGIVLADEGSTTDLVSRHRLLGLVFAGTCVLLPMLAWPKQRLPFRLAIAAALAVSVPTGHFGGELTHGRNFLFEPLAARTAARGTNAAQTTGAQGTGTPTTDAPASESSVFARDVAPLLERTCSKCHNEHKHKGDLLLTTLAGLRAGGENGEVVVPGKPDDSPLLTRCLLPIDDDDHMPPEGKPQPTEVELAALRSWIAAGAPD